MSLTARAAILEQIGVELDAGVLAYVTGDRENLELEVGADVLRRLPRHLDAIGRRRRLALVLYTLGGDTNTPWPFVNFLRAYCDELLVLVPFWAHSAGTLIALGADRIYLTRFGTLSPIDPSVSNEFNPSDPAQPGKRIPIAVEDVLAFFQLAAEQGADDTELAPDAFDRLADSVHPLALGNVKRSIEQIWQLAKKLVRLHAPDIDEDELAALVLRLTTGLYSHSHLITRAEAAAFGLPVEQPSAALEDRLLEYYRHLVADLELLEAFDPRTLPAADAVLERGYLETAGTCDAFVTRATVAPGAAFEAASERWETMA
jgi:hypothetical protein